MLNKDKEKIYLALKKLAVRAAVLLFAIVVVITISGCGSNNYTGEGVVAEEDADDAPGGEAVDDGEEDAAIPEDASAVEETVTIKAKADGTPISAKLKKSNDDLEESVDVNDLPFSVKVTYYLDDKEVTAEEIKGTTGNVRIRFNYENKAKTKVNIDGEERETIVPFAFITMVSLPDDRFHNVEVTNGDIATVSGNRLVYGYAIPGLSDSLKLDAAKEKIKSVGDAIYSSDEKEEEQKEYVEISAYAVDFKVDFTATIVSNGFLRDVKDGTITDISEMVDSFSDLTSAGNELVNGAGSLRSGAGSFGNGLTEYVNGVSGLKSGASALSEGAAGLKSGAESLSSGVSQLSAGASQLSQGATELSAGASQLASGIAALEQAVGGMEGMEEIQRKLAELSAAAQSLSSGAEGLSGGAAEISTGISGISEGAAELSGGASALKNGADKLAQGASTLESSGSSVTSGFNSLKSGINAMESGIIELNNEVLGKLGSLSKGEIPETIELFEAMKMADMGFTAWNTFDGKEGRITFILETEAVEQ